MIFNMRIPARDSGDSGDSGDEYADDAKRDVYYHDYVFRKYILYIFWLS